MNYADFPPVKLFLKVLHNCPRAALQLAYLWKLSKKKNGISIRIEDTKKQFLITKTVFRSNLIELGRLGILTFEENLDFFLIDLIDR